MTLTNYYDEICKQPLLEKEEEQELLEIYFSDKTSAGQKELAKNKIISANLRFVFKRAKSLAKGDPNLFEDLIAAGNEGLLVGLENFDVNSGYRFLTYAGWWIFQRQLKEMSRVRLVQIPIWKQQLSVKIMRAQEKAEEPLTIEQLMEIFPDVKEKDLRELSETRYLTFYLDDLLEEEKADESAFSIETDISEDNSVEELVESDFQADDVQRLLSYLTDDEATVIRFLYGLHDGKIKSSSFIAELLDISRDEVRRIKKTALQKLRKSAIRPPNQHQ